MKFFVPFAESTKEAISVIRSIGEEHFGNFSPALKQMIYTVQYQHNGKSMVATVGEDVDTYYNESFPTVIAIFPPRHNGEPIRICLKDRGVIRGEPIFVVSFNYNNDSFCSACYDRLRVYFIDKKFRKKKNQKKVL